MNINVKNRTTRAASAVFESKAETRDHEYSRRYPPGSAAERYFRATLRLQEAVRLWTSRVDEQLRLHGQTRSTWEALLYSSLWSDDGEQTQSSLAKSVHTDGPNLVRVLDRLEGDGLIERVACSVDRRAKCIRVTQAGEKVIEDLLKIINPMRAEIFADLSDNEVERMIKSVEKISTRCDPKTANDAEDDY